MRYHLSYKVECLPSGLPKEQAEELAEHEDKGFCTAVVVLSLLYPPDGSYSCLPLSRDGRTSKSLPVAEVWKAWVSLAAWLSQHNELTPMKKLLCAEVFDDVRKAINDGRGPIHGEDLEEEEPS